MIGTFLICTLTVPLEIPTLGVIWTEYRGACEVTAIDQPTIPEDSPPWVFVDCGEDLEFVVRPNKTWKVNTKFWDRLGGSCNE